MDWDRVAGNWAEWKGRIQERWGKLTDDHLDVVAGRREQLAGRIQQLYGLSPDDAQRQLRNWERHIAREESQEFDEADLVLDDDAPSTHIKGRG